MNGFVPGADAPDDEGLCRCAVIHEETVARVRRGLTDDAGLRGAAALFRALDDPTRLKIINALLLAELCVCDIAALLDMSQSAVSHHLKTLKASRLVKYRREGKAVYYALDDEHVANVFYQGILHVGEGSAGGGRYV